jgi:hypothetical protein
MSLASSISDIISMYKELQVKWNDLVERVNEKGGEDFLKHGIMPEDAPPQFSQDEIKRLLMLCHPDKHDGKAMAVEMTQKLLRLRRA